MNILCWNYQGIGGDLTVDDLLEKTRLHSLEVMACIHAIEPRGIAGGMCLFWKDANDVVLVKHEEFFY